MEFFTILLADTGRLRLSGSVLLILRVSSTGNVAFRAGLFGTEWSESPGMIQVASHQRSSFVSFRISAMLEELRWFYLLNVTGVERDEKSEKVRELNGRR